MSMERQQFMLKSSLFFILLLSFSTLFAVQSKNLYNSCKYCHGYKGEKIYIGKIPAINKIGVNDLITLLKGYKQKSINQYGFGKIMYNQVKNLNNDNIVQVSKYIHSFRDEQVKSK